MVELGSMYKWKVIRAMRMLGREMMPYSGWLILGAGNGMRYAPYKGGIGKIL
ncbi:hypothetical protein BC834DRAFT_851000 [Gloeopeniophorella convolvens]|nr:hypothetical protein BC834DRAFT_851000 [Gloeopeniophorella convolvens]